MAVIVGLARILLALSYRGVRGPQGQNALPRARPARTRRSAWLAVALGAIAVAAIGEISGWHAWFALDVSGMPMVGAASVAGLALGFGIRRLLHARVLGLSIVLESQIRRGDFVLLGPHAGWVQEITLAHVVLQEDDGPVRLVPFGAIHGVIRIKPSHTVSVIDIGVGYGEDLDKVMALMRRVGAAMRADPQHLEHLLAEIELVGVTALLESAIMVRARFRVPQSQRTTVRREYLLRLKQCFDEHRIHMPHPWPEIDAGA